MDGNDVRKEQEQDHDGDDSIEAGHMYGRAVTKAAGRWRGDTVTVSLDRLSNQSSASLSRNSCSHAPTTCSIY